MIKDKYVNNNKPESPGNIQVNATIERIHQVLGNLVRTYNLQEIYVDDADPFMGILNRSAFAVQSTYHRKKGKSPGQLVFGRAMILPIDHIVNWRYMLQRKQAQPEKGVIRVNSIRINYDFNIGYKIIVRRNQVYKYKTAFQGT